MSEFLTFDALGTLAGLTLAVYMITTGLVAVVPDWSPQSKRIALTVGLVIAALVTVLTTPDNPQAWLTAIINAFMAFLSATGLSSVVAAGQERRQPAIQAEANLQATRQWWESW